MADPLSIAAGIITVIGAAEAVAKGLGKLISLKGLPSTFVALNNEISDLRLVVQEVDGFLLDNAFKATWIMRKESFWLWSA